MRADLPIGCDMAAFATSAVRRLALRSTCLLAPCTLAVTLLLAACEREGAESPRQIDGMKADLEESKRRISHIQNSLAAKDAELAVNVQSLEKMKGDLAELQKTLDERNAQLRAAMAATEELKKRDSIVFGEIVALQAQLPGPSAVSRYQKFIVDYPKSPLVGNAKAAIAQLTEIPPEVRKQVPAAAISDAGKKDRDFAKSFNEGYMTLPELAPYLKKKTLQQVLTLLGKPNQSFRDNTEIGYADRAVSPTTGTRGMLVIAFDEGVVSSLRVEYAGQRFVP